MPPAKKKRTVSRRHNDSHGEDNRVDSQICGLQSQEEENRLENNQVKVIGFDIYFTIIVSN